MLALVSCLCGAGRTLPRATRAAPRRIPVTVMGGRRGDGCGVVIWVGVVVAVGLMFDVHDRWSGWGVGWVVAGASDAGWGEGLSDLFSTDQAEELG